ncbi:hypothetical protein Mal65_10880 [Crateriforma conspicua]|nr:hypothetical protein Mal65_10880 [Crateriforma conspicua]
MSSTVRRDYIPARPSYLGQPQALFSWPMTRLEGHLRSERGSFGDLTQRKKNGQPRGKPRWRVLPSNSHLATKLRAMLGLHIANTVTDFILGDEVLVNG